MEQKIITAPTSTPVPVSAAPVKWLVADTAALLKKYLLMTWRMPIWTFFGLVQPLLWLIIFGQLFKNLSRLPGFPRRRLHPVPRTGGDRDDRAVRLLLVGSEPASRLDLRNHGKTFGRPDFADCDCFEPPVACGVDGGHSGFSLGRCRRPAWGRFSPWSGPFLDLGCGASPCDRFFRHFECPGDDSEKRRAVGGDGKHVDAPPPFLLPGAGADRFHAGLDADGQPDQSGHLRGGSGPCLVSRDVFDTSFFISMAVLGLFTFVSVIAAVSIFSQDRS
ncbi:MAG: hypothetical protein MPW15_22500 [Candidatus Manganitrophus sp.]|nr:hypothetical protein [Candidatus Manganitrophus sp.]